MTFLGWLSDPFKWLSDLQLVDEKVTLNHLEPNFHDFGFAMLILRIVYKLCKWMDEVSSVETSSHDWVEHSEKK